MDNRRRQEQGRRREVSEGMRKYLAIIIATVIFGFFARGGDAATTNNLANIRRNFLPDATLFTDELDTVVTLAKSCGIETVAEVRTFHYLPGSFRGIQVISAEKVDGRKVRYQTLEIFRAGWSVKTKPTGPLQIISIGEFWVESLGLPQQHELTIFTTTNGTIRVEVEAGIPLDAV